MMNVTTAPTIQQEVLMLKADDGHPIAATL
ncbi:MAG: hypothetical protein RL291_725, partial [Pseudomonadota bacterium]